MMKRESLRIKNHVAIEDIQHKKVHASFTRSNEHTVETGVGEIMATVNAAGMPLVWIQFRDDNEQKYLRLYLNEERVRSLKQAGTDQYDFVIEGVLDSGPEIE